MNFPQFQPGSVPVPKQTPLSPVPEVKGTADLIMQAAQLSQQAQLSRERMRQDAFKNLNEAIQGAMDLHERHIHNQAQLAMADAMTKLRQPLIEAETDKNKTATELNKYLLNNLRNNQTSTGPVIASASGREFQEITDPKTGKKSYKLLPSPKETRKGDAQLSAALTALDQLEAQGNKLGLAETSGQALARGAILQAQSLIPSTEAGQFKAAAFDNFIAAARALGGRVSFPEIQTAAKSFPSFMDTGGENGSFTKKIGRIRVILQAAQNTKQGKSGISDRFSQIESQHPELSESEIFDLLYSEGH